MSLFITHDRTYFALQIILNKQTFTHAKASTCLDLIPQKSKSPFPVAVINLIIVCRYWVLQVHIKAYYVFVSVEVKSDKKREPQQRTVETRISIKWFIIDFTWSLSILNLKVSPHQIRLRLISISISISISAVRGCPLISISCMFL